MTMGERIRQARIEAGLSQRQLAGEMMTRNMLSALEHDGANPSIGTLKYLSEKLCKPIGYFLGEEIPEWSQMEHARELYQQGSYDQCLKEIGQLQYEPFQQERKLLEILCLLEMAEQACKEGKLPYSRSLLERCAAPMEECIYAGGEMERRWLIASARAAEKGKGNLVRIIPAMDDLLLLRAESALEAGQYQMAGCLLDAAEDRHSGRWNFLRAEACFGQQDYQCAARFYHEAEKEKWEKVEEKLEICYREMGNYKMAYYYAKKEK